jgi:flavin reductase (DIM6/NTAB) family NADH-FMN oxidoreductase RutF
VGPFPPRVENDEQRDEYDRLRRRVLWTMPSGLYVVGSADGERKNLMTLNWATQVSSDPKLVGIGVEKSALTHGLIERGRAFSVCILSREDRAIVRKFTKPVEADSPDTLNGFPCRTGRTGAPILTQAVAAFECEVRHAVDVGSHTFFIGEIVDAGFQQPEDTPVLRMEDTRMNYGG